MSPEKKKQADAKKTNPPQLAEGDPLACMRLPANPPQRNVKAFVISLVLFLAWLGYLVIVAYFG